MRVDILTSSNQRSVREYVTKKFTTFNSWTYSKGTRRKKCLQYYQAAEEGGNGQIVKDVYGLIFREPFPKEPPPKKTPTLVNPDDWISDREDKISRAERVLKTLQHWQESGEYQTGEEFFLRLKQIIADFDPTWCDPRELRTESEARLLSHLTGSTTRTSREVSAQYEGMIGIKQSAEIQFEAYSSKWGEITAKLEEEFKAGVWSSGEAKARFEKLGFSAELQAAIAIGLQLEISGSCQWKKGKAGLELGGDCSAFAGAWAEGSLKLSVNARKGLELAIKGGAFAGLSAKASGTVAFSYGDEDLVRVTAEASISVGVGAEFELKIKAPIFGPTAIDVKGELTVGVGGGVGVEMEINFTEMGLAASNEFRKLIYLPTLIRGYQMTLMTSDRRNLHYLEKCQKRLVDVRDEFEDSLVSYYKAPVEKRRLLMELDD
ncbi:MAG: hypothetical protein GC160_29855 [Acidobacteria bacterium]|nr:hypothetical protein [Acidobacteriota bacterium]